MRRHISDISQDTRQWNLKIGVSEKIANAIDGLDEWISFECMTNVGWA